MANMKISGLPDGASLSDNDMIEIARPGSPNASLRVSAKYIFNYLESKSPVFTGGLGFNGAPQTWLGFTWYRNNMFTWELISDNGSIGDLHATSIKDDGSQYWVMSWMRNDISVQLGGVLWPASDNAYSLGTAAHRFSQVYAGTATINTSDGSEKTLADTTAPVTLDALVSALNDLPTQVFQWNAMIAKKGVAGARYHVGYIAQTVYAALVAKGIDPTKTALWCNDAVIPYIRVTDEKGDRWEKVPATNADGSQKYRQGLRIDNLQAVLIEAQRRRITTLETNYAALAARVTALEAKA